MLLQLLAVLVLGLMCGSEFNVAAFAHPTLNQQPQTVHALMRSSLASLLGRVMPFWMVGSVVLTVLLLLPFEHLDKVAWQLDCNRPRHSSSGCGLFADRPGTHQQPHCKMDTGISS